MYIFAISITNIYFNMKEITDKQTADALKNVETFTTKIAGINHRLTPSNTNYGYVEGYAVADPQNQYDPNAVALYRKKDGKQLGYIPKDDLGDFSEFAKVKNYFQRTNFVGEIHPFYNDDDKPTLASEITFISEDNKDDDYNLVLLQYQKWYNEDANERIAEFNSKLNNIREMNNLKFKDIPTTYETMNNKNGGCLTGIVIAVIISLAALL